jgi:hypothetical protein
VRAFNAGLGSDRRPSGAGRITTVSQFKVGREIRQALQRPGPLAAIFTLRRLSDKFYEIDNKRFVLQVYQRRAVPWRIDSVQGYGTISGTVTDPSGAVVTGASVVATRCKRAPRRPRTPARTADLSFPTLLPSGYTQFRSQAAGFESYSQKGIVLEADQALTINITLKIGSQTANRQRLGRRAAG